MAQDERLQAAEQLLARERMMQDMRADALAREKAARRRWLMILVPAGSVLGSVLAAAMDVPVFLMGLAGAAFGWLAALFLARRA